MIADHRYKYLEHIRYYAEIVAYPISYTANLPTSIWNKIYSDYAARTELAQENEKLRKQNLQMATRINQFQNISQEKQTPKETLKVYTKL